jgi:uncharacterized phiE125 gp8 family phage protein
MAELKLHLRLDTDTLDDNLGLTQSLAFASHVIKDEYTTHAGQGVDVLGHEAIVILSAGTNGTGGTNDTRIEESDTLASGYTAWTGGAFTQVTEANDNADYKVQYTGSKQYIRTASKVLVAACVFGTSILVNEATSAEEDLLTAILIAGREYIEDITCRYLLTQEWDYSINHWPDSNYIVLPGGNLQTVTSVKYTDSDGTTTTMVEDTDYIVETNGEACGRIVLPYGVQWPSFTPYTSNPIVIRFVAGWTTQAAVPYKIKAALRMVCADMWEMRGEPTIGQTVIENKTVARLLASSKLWEEF